MHYDVNTGSTASGTPSTAFVYCSSRFTIQLTSFRMIICWLSLLPELIEPRSVRKAGGRLCRNLDPARLGACTSLRSGNGSISMAFCDCDRWLRCPEAFLAVKREILLDLLLDLVLDEPYPSREVWPVLSSKIVVSVVLSPRRNGRILGIVAEMIDQ